MDPFFQYYGASPYYSALPYGSYCYPSYSYINRYGAYYFPTPPASPQVSTSTVPSPVPCLNTITDSVNLSKVPQTKRRRFCSQSSAGSLSSESTAPDVVKIPKSSISDASFLKQAFVPLGTDISKVDHETLSRSMPYNQNMVRKFPKKERTAKEQRRRDKNTLACRISRCKEKFRLAEMQKEYTVFKQRNFELASEMIPMAAYLNELIRYGIAFKPDARNELVMALGKTLKLDFLARMPIQKAIKRNYSIAFILDME